MPLELAGYGTIPAWEDDARLLYVQLNIAHSATNGVLPTAPAALKQAAELGHWPDERFQAAWLIVQHGELLQVDRHGAFNPEWREQILTYWAGCRTRHAGYLSQHGCHACRARGCPNQLSEGWVRRCHACGADLWRHFPRIPWLDNLVPPSVEAPVPSGGDGKHPKPPALTGKPAGDFEQGVPVPSGYTVPTVNASTPVPSGCSSVSSFRGLFARSLCGARMR